MIFVDVQDSTSVENALYSDPRVMEAAAVGVPDKRLGELVSAVVTLKTEFNGKVKGEELIEIAKQL
jgi:acyl-CoA synthetase (AMP-forming)/AMP-acid ligase II